MRGLSFELDEDQRAIADMARVSPPRAWPRSQLNGTGKNISRLMCCASRGARYGRDLCARGVGRLRSAPGSMRR